MILDAVGDVLPLAVGVALMLDHNATIMSVILLLLGAKVLGDGISVLSS